MPNNESSARKTHGNTIYKKTWARKYWGFNGVLMLAFWRLVWYIVTFRAGQGFVAAASSYYSAASDIVRNGDMSKITDAMKYYFAGGVSVVCVFVCLTVRLGNLRWCTANELDVLGTICTKAKLFGFAKILWEKIVVRVYTGLAEDHTLALAAGWRMDDPNIQDKCTYKWTIRNLMEKHPEWPPQIKARLYSRLGEKELEKIERQKIADQFT